MKMLAIWMTPKRADGNFCGGVVRAGCTGDSQRPTQEIYTLPLTRDRDQLELDSYRLLVAVQADDSDKIVELTEVSGPHFPGW